ncbi:alpha/beta hydrolase family protein [Pseudobacteroides cellulosolvens]|uniref:4-O-methyl-glucuronoyl methylesterase-like domain-containing protein n=1 Tax=Pseudobacteroides cellulosolvens ATCC 35603 = DSM 2933 TaxID=398512 RepID=A0A0L6JSX2_9FIRM|nr:hypothetical protein [Pseudobacteroides cellulosolvens]KNY28790.1 hypothetical protein Bccel_4064 [Pseudobacteroides cellulosolvens ATCC 35603 = DSM 2933]
MKTDGSQTSKPYPVLINLTYSAEKNSLADASAALSRGYAVVTISYQQLGEDSTKYRSTAFFPAYPEYDWRDISAWTWGISRAVDYIKNDPAIDRQKIMITGVSRLAQAVLLAGAFDERIALTAPVAGGMALRYSGKEMGRGLVHFRPGGHGITSEDWSAILNFADQKLLNKNGTRRFDILPPDSQLK